MAENREVNHLGAFADWGLSKDLFIPFGEQQHPLKAGAHAVVKVYLDNQGRPTGSTRINRWIEDTSSALTVGQEVELLIAEQRSLASKPSLTINSGACSTAMSCIEGCDAVRRSQASFNEFVTTEKLIYHSTVRF